MWNKYCNFVSEQLLSERHVRLPEYEQLSASVVNITSDGPCRLHWALACVNTQEERAAENSQEHLAHFLWNCAGVIILIITETFWPDQDGSRRRKRRGEVLGEEMQAGQHVQPHLRLLSCRDYRRWEHRNAELLTKMFSPFFFVYSFNISHIIIAFLSLVN